MKFKCKTCQTELNLLANESEVVCPKCGRKHSSPEIRTSIEDQIQNRELALADLRKRITAMQGSVRGSNDEISEIKSLANDLKISLVVLVIAFLAGLITVNKSETLFSIAVMILGAALIATFVLLGKICAMGLVDSLLFSADECKKYPAYVHGFLWFLAYCLLPMMIYGTYKVLRNIKALDSNTYRSGKEIELSELSRRSFELQNEIESLRAELNH